MKYQAWLPVLLFGLAVGCVTDSAQDRFDGGLQLLYENRYEDAESYFLALARDLGRSESPEDRGWRAKALFQVGRIDNLYLNQPRRAIANFREALKLDPQGLFGFDALRTIAELFQDRLGDYRSAALEFERLVQLYPDKKGIEKYQYRIAQCYFMIQDFNQARTEARILLEKNPQGPIAAQAQLLVANSYYIEGNYPEAAEAHERLLATSPDAEMTARSLFELGLCYQEVGEFTKAEKAFLEALKNHPSPGLVQAQLTALRERSASEGEGKNTLTSAADGRVVAESATKTAPGAAPKRAVPIGQPDTGRPSATGTAPVKEPAPRPSPVQPPPAEKQTPEPTNGTSPEPTPSEPNPPGNSP